ncbi:MAG: type III-B CRISPR module RAMP protein Cmr6 [Pseudomonadota bacterium]|nr:type III-B CRISPR module RAMP protein Cmr6 [Pseudomonadota bacterium]
MAGIEVANRHPGLQLDKFSAGGTQAENQSFALDAVCRTRGYPELLVDLRRRRAGVLASLGVTCLRVATTGPLTLHLSRASALENAGICLHPLYGFVYLPASGLKGMARAWAETAWKSAQPEAAQAQRQIDEVFGTGGTADSAAGRVVFHDAWPETWPKLVRDLLNNHHRDYYQAGKPPGDWESPIPVSFLAIGAGVTFDAPLSPRRPDDAPLLDLARGWLLSAFCHRGAGAKTNAGYGAFRPVEGSPPPLPAPAGERFVATLELVTPGFFAGAAQDGSDCDLRPASLRGQLRWWWRAMFAGHLDLAALRSREAQVWGDTTRGGAVRVTVTAQGAGKVVLFNKKAEVPGGGRHQRSGGKPVTQGLWYASYGMDDGANHRHYIRPGAKWSVELTARPTGRAGLAPAQALAEARAALWLLCHFGGVGSKSRKGFGSFADIEVPGIDSLQACLDLAASVAGAAAVRTQGEPSLTLAGEAALEAEWPLAANTTWQQAIDNAGAALAAFVRGVQPKAKRGALGMPRKGQERSNLPQRHAAPYCLHVGRRGDGTQVLRFLGFPAARLPDAATSREVLSHLRDALAQSFGSMPQSGPVGRSGPAGFPCKGRHLGEPVTVLRQDGDTFFISDAYGDTEFVPVDEVEFD